MVLELLRMPISKAEHWGTNLSVCLSAIKFGPHLYNFQPQLQALTVLNCKRDPSPVALAASEGAKGAERSWESPARVSFPPALLP